MNTRIVTAKDQMLQKIRQCLQTKSDQLPENPGLVPLYKKDEELVDVAFARELTEAGGRFVYCDGEIDLIENLILLVEEAGIQQLIVWEKGIQKILETYGFPYQGSEPSTDQYQAAITSCEVLIARTGSVLLTNANASGRRLSILPSIHIVLAKASQLIWDLEDGLDFLQRRYGARLPTLITAVTGPSRSTSIENQTVVGAQGPKELYVIVLEDRF